MLTPEGCRDRRRRLLDRLRPDRPLLFADPLNLRYLANFHVDPFSLGADFGGLLALDPDGRSTLIHDNRVPPSVDTTYVDERSVVDWYAGKAPETGPRRMQLAHWVHQLGGADGRIHDHPTDSMAGEVWHTIVELRRSKDADEIAVLRQCARAAEAGHAWARSHIAAGMRELDVYHGVSRACADAAGRPVIVYGDFIVCDGPAKRTGMPTDRVLSPGDLFILDFSVVLNGYRCDFTNTLVVAAQPSANQRKMFDSCVAAMTAGERILSAGSHCRDVYNTVRESFRSAGMADHFPHHAGHGLGLSHPEPPYIVENATETLAVGDVITLEPGLYIDGIGGMRIEHNYRITETGFERISGHEITLT